MLNFGYCVPLAFLRRLAGNAMPLLESLTITDSAFDFAEIPINAFGLAPRLRQIDLDCYYHPCALSLPWNQLTEVSVSDEISPNGYLHIIRNCHNLIKATFVIRESLPPSSGSITLPFMRSLNIKSGRSVDNIFDQLRAPVLEDVDITLQFPDYGYIWPHKQFMPFLLAAQSTMRSLRLHDAAITEHNLIEYLQCAPGLVELDVWDLPERGQDAITDRVFELLTYRGSGEPLCLCPNLEVIFLMGSHIPYNDQSIVDMVESRWTYIDDKTLVGSVLLATPTTYGFLTCDYLHDSIHQADALPRRPSRLKEVTVWVQDKDAKKKLEKIRKEGLDVDIAVVTTTHSVKYYSYP
jgi:hypothetical protein